MHVKKVDSEAFVIQSWGGPHEVARWRLPLTTAGKFEVSAFCRNLMISFFDPGDLLSCIFVTFSSDHHSDVNKAV